MQRFVEKNNKNVPIYKRTTVIAELLEPLEHAINEVLIPAVTKVERVGGLEFKEPVVTSSSVYGAPVKVTNPLMKRLLSRSTRLPTKAKRDVELHVPTEKGSSNWLTVIPLKQLNKKELREAIKLRHDWEMTGYAHDLRMRC